MPANLENSAVPVAGKVKDWKRPVFIPILKKGNAKKNIKTTAQVHSSHRLAK